MKNRQVSLLLKLHGVRSNRGRGQTLLYRVARGGAQRTVQEAKRPASRA